MLSENYANILRVVSKCSLVNIEWIFTIVKLML